MRSTGNRKKQQAERNAIQQEVDDAERALALAGVEAEYAMEEAKKARCIEDKARRRLVQARVKAQAITKCDES